jgi:hypothetical protein
MGLLLRMLDVCPLADNNLALEVVEAVQVVEVHAQLVVDQRVQVQLLRRSHNDHAQATVAIA